jgi:transposase
MMIVGCDFHPSFQQVPVLNTKSGEMREHKLVHATGEAEQFYRRLGMPSLAGMESVGNSQWFVQLLEQLGHEIWIGDAAQIRASYVRKQKTDKRDAAHILKLLVEGRFPRIWVPDAEMRDQRQLLIHRQKLVQIRTRVKNELQHLMMNQGVQKKHKLWSVQERTELEKLSFQHWAGQRRDNLLCLLKMLDQQIDRIDQAVALAAQQSDRARLLMTQPGVGPVTALVFVLTLGDVERFARSKQVASYLGLIPSESSSGGKQRMGAISKQGNRRLRVLMVEAANAAVRFDPERRFTNEV